MKKLLMVAFHYPPLRGSSGIQRTLKFSRYLPNQGWQPIILTANPRAYSEVGGDQLHEIPPDIPVKRAFALDSAQHLSIRGSYLKWLALPDRWVSWWLGAVPAGLLLLRKYQPKVIWSTYPIATAHLIGLTLHRLTGVPWVADCRDSMTEQGYPCDPTTWRVYRGIERMMIKYATRIVFTAPGTLRMYAERYPQIALARWTVIANGYDEENFIAAERSTISRSLTNDRILLVHSGSLYPSERDPRTFYAALAALRQAGKISSSNLKIILRASGYEEYHLQYLREHGIEGIVSLEPSTPYREALAEMLNADGLLLFQASNCNYQIPAKIYEYLRARRPIFALTDPRGDTAGVLKAAGINTMEPLDSKERIMEGLLDFLIRVRAGNAPIANDHVIKSYARESQAQELVKLLNSLTISDG